MADKNHRVLSEKYFEFFSNRDTESLGKLYSDDIDLKDWNGEWSGKEEVLAEISCSLDDPDSCIACGS